LDVERATTECVQGCNIEAALAKSSIAKLAMFLARVPSPLPRFLVRPELRFIIRVLAQQIVVDGYCLDPRFSGYSFHSTGSCDLALISPLCEHNISTANGIYAPAITTVCKSSDAFRTEQGSLSSDSYLSSFCFVFYLNTCSINPHPT
jgi:hypothetical protein